MAQLRTDVRYIKGIGEQRAKSLRKLGINTLFDLISYFPRAYEDRSVFRSIGSLLPDDTACVRALVVTSPRLSRIRKGLDIVKLRVADESGSMDLTFFNQSYVKDSLKYGSYYVFYGKVGGTLQRPEMTNPVFEPEEKAGSITGRIVPIYRLTASLSQNILSKAVRQGLEQTDSLIPEVLPNKVRERFNLSHADFAYHNIHFPADMEALALARRRLVFEELFVLACALGLLRSRKAEKTGIVPGNADVEELYAALPFSPTGAQRRVIGELMSDLLSGRPMNRLIQGDVGSGKTLCAAAAAWYVYKSGFQTAFMAPTEILAQQHYNTLTELLSPLGVRVGLLTGSLGAKRKREVKVSLALGEIDIIVGTHALLSEGVDFFSLALVITDEQHRFGVNQRSLLTEKGENPHVLVMSATPIPRTLALIIYGDLDISIIDELPPGRRPVETFGVDERMRPRVMKFIRRLVSEGRQVYIVCPMVEENEALNIKAAEKYYEQLKTRVLPDLRLALVHGKMKPADKDAVMGAFVRGETDVLVATTVIEVGVDVPNASLMVIENAERFGLSQLHQLRGRVGRGGHKSYCIMFCEGGSENPRISTMIKTNDGFKISEEDLKLRGPGDFFGSRQHGLPEMKIADLSADMSLLSDAQGAAAELLESDPNLMAPENGPLRKRIEELFEVYADTFN
ncbi:MAG: ATP-dependent DNA helicase RecG [Clostridiales bacterium]|jgi:ATP-dependent DNA helicase RecG|nr:ATP-dependent DNA helicase RecG [Clostridiales bacterium]